MTEGAVLADHLDQRSDAILAHWRAAVEEDSDVPDASRLARSEFLDHIPILLERLAERLRGQPADAALAGQQHGGHRWRQGYDVAEVVTELGHLRTALRSSTASFARENDWDLDRFASALSAIDDVLDEATAESVRQFQEDSQAETQKALDDVQDRQRVVEEAWNSARLERSKLRTIVRSLPLAAWVVDADGTIVGTNAEAERMQGFSHTDGNLPNVFHLGPEYQISTLDGIVCPHDRLPIVRALRGETVSREEYIWDLRSGPRTLSINAAPLADSEGNGAVIGAVAIAVDMTAQKRFETALAEAESQFRVIAEKSPVMIWRTDPAGRCDYVNQTWCEFRGLGPGHHLGEGWADGLHHDDRTRVLGELRHALARRSPFELSYRMRRHDGVFRWVSDRGTPYYDPGGKYLGHLGSCIDITARIELEEALERQKAVAEEASRHKTRLVSALSHDVRTPLNAVVLAAQLMEVHLDGNVDADVQECLRTIRHSVRNVLDLLGDLLDLSKLDAGATPSEVSRFPLEPVLAECLASIEPQARQKGLDVRLDAGGLAGVSFETDRSKLKQILANLLSNALRYTDRGHVRLSGSRTEDSVVIAVEDTGVGIAENDQKRIFEEFATLDTPQSRSGEGTGLGLAICRRLAMLLGGEIRLVSAHGQGSTFSLVLPASVLTLTAPAAVTVRDGSGGFDGAGAVLIAEDHADSRHTLARFLRRMGFRVLEAGNGRDALAAARQEPDLRVVLMDVNMPEMDGVEATLALRADPKLAAVPIFALTGDVTVNNQHRIAEAGVNGYLEKPVTWDALREALDSVGPRTSRDG